MEFLAFLFVIFLLLSATRSWFDNMPSNQAADYFTNIFGRIIGWIFKGFKFLLFGHIGNQDTTYGSARWIRWNEKRAILNKKNKGIMIEAQKETRISKDKTTHHTLIVGRAGSGKTSRFLKPQLLSELASNEDGCSVVINDPGGYLFKECSHWMATEGGFLVNALNLDDKTFRESNTFNLYDYANDGESVDLGAHILTLSSMPSGGRWGFWETNTQDLFSKLMRIMKELPQFTWKRDLPNLLHLINAMGNQGERITPMILNCSSPTNRALWYSIIEQTPEVYNNTLSTAKSALSLFKADSNLARISRTTPYAIDFNNLRRRKTALFVMCAERDMRFKAPFMNMFWTFLFQFLLNERQGDEPYRQVNILLDELANLVIPGFDDPIISTIRRRKVGICGLIQNLQQLDVRFGYNGAQTVLANMATQIYLGGGITDTTAQKLEQMLGRQTIKTKNGLTGRALMTAQEIEQMDYPYSLFLQGGKPPAKIKMKYAHEIKKFQDRSSETPLEMNLNNTSPMQFVDFSNTEQVPLTHQVGLD